MEKGLLIVVHNGLNEKQYSFIEKISTGDTSFYGYPEDNDQVELTVLHEVYEQIETYKKETNKAPTVIFAVSFGGYIIPKVMEYVGIDHIIHLDEQGNRFA